MAAAMPLALMACGGTAPATEQLAGEQFGAIQAVVDLTAGPIPPPITAVQIEIQPADIIDGLTYDNGTSTWVGVFSRIPLGPQHVVITAYNNFDVVGQGEGDVVITAGTVSHARVQMIDASTPPSPQAHGPILRSVTASSSSPLVGETITLRAEATDPDGDAVTYSWTQTCGGTFGSASSASSTWSDNSAQSCTITVTATSSGGTDRMAIPVTVLEPIGDVSVDATFGRAPYVLSVRLSAPGFLCTIYRDAVDASCRPAIAGSTSLSATVQFEPMPADSGATVTLTDSCGGSSAAGTVDLAGGTASFSWTAPAATSSCLVAATVVRQGLTDVERVGVAVN